MHNPISIMTLNLMGGAIAQYRKDHDFEKLQNFYCGMMCAARESGYRKVDISFWEVKLLGCEFIIRVLNQNCLTVSSYIFADFYASDADQAERIQNGMRAVDTACLLETNVLMLVPMGVAGLEHMAAEDIHRNLIAHWTPIVEYASRKGIICVIEDTPDLRMCLCKASDVAKVLDAVPGLQLVYDSGNMILDGENPVEYVHQFAGRIGFAHLKDIRPLPVGTPSGEKMRDGTPVMTVPTGTGMVNIPGVIHALKQSGYCGGMTVEFAQHEEKTLTESLIDSYQYVQRCLNENSCGC